VNQAFAGPGDRPKAILHQHDAAGGDDAHAKFGRFHRSALLTRMIERAICPESLAPDEIVCFPSLRFYHRAIIF
jgi:hypothetical protein